VAALPVEAVHKQYMSSSYGQQFRLGDSQASPSGEPQLYLLPGGCVPLVAARSGEFRDRQPSGRVGDRGLGARAAERTARIDEIGDVAVEGAFRF
jgi:hypothetical protein